MRLVFQIGMAALAALSFFYALPLMQEEEKVCPLTKYYNSSDKPWTAADERAIFLAKIRCGFIDRKKACLGSFTKRDILDYESTCIQKIRKGENHE